MRCLQTLRSFVVQEHISICEWTWSERWFYQCWSEVEGGMCELLEAGMGPVLVYKYLSTILVEVNTLPRELGKSDFVDLLIW